MTVTAQAQACPGNTEQNSNNGQARTRAKSIGHYILGKTIGEGTFGKVKLGTHILTGERVAVKVLEKERIVEVADVERVAREVHILKLIRHPHIVQLYEIIETRRQLYLIMEYASGGELFDFIVASGRVPEPEACRFFHQITAGVEKIHMMNIVHRDLKPENLLLDDHKSIKIVDFGLSNVYRDGQLLKTACGSPCYAAPEMIAGHSYIPSLCDLWSCGVILFALVCGYLPFEDQNTAALYKKILAADYKAPSFINESVRDLIAGLLTTDPNRRFTVQDIRNHPWYRQMLEASVSASLCIPGQHDLEEDVLRDLDAFGFPRDYAVRCLELNKHNHVTTTYYLLAEKKRRVLDKLDRMLPGRDPHAGFDAEPPVQLRQRDSEVSDAHLEDVALVSSPGAAYTSSDMAVQDDATQPQRRQSSARYDRQSSGNYDRQSSGDARVSVVRESSGAPERPPPSPRPTSGGSSSRAPSVRVAPAVEHQVASGTGMVTTSGGSVQHRAMQGASPRSPGYPQGGATTPHWSSREAASSSATALRYPSSSRSVPHPSQPRPQPQSPTHAHTPQGQKATETPRRRTPTSGTGTTSARASRGVVVATSSPQEQQQQHGHAAPEVRADAAPGTPGRVASATSQQNATTPPYTRPSATTPGSLVHRIFSKDSPPSASASSTAAAGPPTAGAVTPQPHQAPGGCLSARRSPATGPSAGLSSSTGSSGLGVRPLQTSAASAAASTNSTYTTRPPTTPRDLNRHGVTSNDSARRRAANSASIEAPQSARARLGGRPPVPLIAAASTGVPTATTPRASAVAPLSARGERPAASNRALSASPHAAQVSTRESLGRSINAPVGSATNTAGSRATAWNGLPQSSRATRLATR